MAATIASAPATTPAPFLTVNVWPEHTPGRWTILACGHDWVPTTYGGALDDDTRERFAALANIVRLIAEAGDTMTTGVEV